MKSIERTFLLGSVLLFSLTGCGLKGPLYLPDEHQQAVPASSEPARQPVLEGSRVRALPPAPQSQKKDRERAHQAAPSDSTPPMSSPMSSPGSPPDPDHPSTTPPPPGQ